MGGSDARVGNPPRGMKRLIELRVIDFIYANLVAWRDDCLREYVESEEKLTGQLHDFLQHSCGQQESFYFRIEEPQHGRRKIDLAVKPTGIYIHAKLYSSIYTPIIVFEAKRLPAPERSREQEYVTGGAKISGGIQRFKMGEHGLGYCVSGMIGYVQSDDINFLYDKINNIILNLSKNSSDLLSWKPNECLEKVDDKMNVGLAKFVSHHFRNVSGEICLYHLWIDMTKAREACRSL